jgi:phosphohistidine phosphatase
MKTLYLVRHAKSSWKNPDIPDYERPLLEKGKKRTKKIIDYLHANEIHTKYVISSPAVRAYETAIYIANALNYPVEKIQLAPKLYYGGIDHILEIISRVSNNYNSLMMVGHNPSITNLTNEFIEPKIDYLPTSGMVCFDFDTDTWTRIGTAENRLRFIIYPKLLTDSKSDYLFETSFRYERNM